MSSRPLILSSLFSRLPFPTINYSNNRTLQDKVQRGECGCAKRTEDSKTRRQGTWKQSIAISRRRQTTIKKKCVEITHLRLVPSVRRERPSLAQWRHRGQKLHTPHQRQRYKKCEKKETTHHPQSQNREKKANKKKYVLRYNYCFFLKKMWKKEEEEEKRCNKMAKSRAQISLIAKGWANEGRKGWGKETSVLFF